MVVRYQHVAPSTVSRSNRQLALSRDGRFQIVSLTSPCYRRRVQCFDSGNDRCKWNRDIRKTEQIANPLCPASALSTRPNCPDFEGSHQLRTCSL